MSNGVDAKIAAILPLLPLKDGANLTAKRARDELVALTDSRKDVPLPQPATLEDILVEGAAALLRLACIEPVRPRRRSSYSSTAGDGSPVISTHTTAMLGHLRSRSMRWFSA